MPLSIEKENFEIKIECLDFIIKNLNDFSKSNVKSFVKPILSCLLDKHKEIRILGE